MRLKLVPALVALACTPPALLAQVTDSMILDDARSVGDVLSWGLGTEGQRYSPLRQVNTATVSRARAGMVVLVRRREAARAGIAAGHPQRQDVRHRVVLAPVRARRDHRQEAVEVRASPARRHHALLRRGQPRRRAVRQARHLHDAGRADRGARPGQRRRGLEGEDRRLQGRLFEHRRAHHRQWPAADRRLGRRVRRGGPRRGARREDRPAWSGRGRPSKATWAITYDADGKPEGKRRLGHGQPVLAGRPVEDRRRRHLARRHLRRRRPGSPISAPATRPRGTATCARATTCSPARRWPST